MSDDKPAPAKILAYREHWDEPLKGSGPAPPKELAEKVGARRKKIVRGEGGFFMNRSQLPPGYRVPPHHHNHDEMLIVLAGGCTFDDDFGEARADDTIVIPATEPLRLHLRPGRNGGPDDPPRRRDDGALRPPRCPRVRR